MERKPIWIAWTYSFWLGILPALLTLLDFMIMLGTNAETAGPFAAVLALILPWSAEQISEGMRAASPFFALWVAYQRAGAARPYTLDPRAR